MRQKFFSIKKDFIFIIFHLVQKEWHQFVDFFFLESSIFARHGSSRL